MESEEKGFIPPRESGIPADSAPKNKQTDDKSGSSKEEASPFPSGFPYEIPTEYINESGGWRKKKNKKTPEKQGEKS